jgi:hypothetical protein
VREIIADFKREKLDYWVTGYGTGGTLKGVSRVLAKEMPDTAERYLSTPVFANVPADMTAGRAGDFTLDADRAARQVRAAGGLRVHPPRRTSAT